MPPTSFPDLAPELLIEIFKSIDCFTDASALSRTSHHMHAIFKNNVPVILDAILPSAIDCFEEASRLVQAQEKAEAIITARNSYRNEHPTTATELAIERVQRFFSNIQAGSTLGFYLEKHEITAGGRNLIQDRRKSMRAFYRAFTFAVLFVHPVGVLGGRRFPLYLVDHDLDGA